MSARRVRTVIFAGILVIVAGVVLFAAASGITAPSPGVSYDAAQRERATLTVRWFASMVLLGGFVITTVGLHAWCRLPDDDPMANGHG